MNLNLIVTVHPLIIFVMNKQPMCAGGGELFYVGKHWRHMGKEATFITG